MEEHQVAGGTPSPPAPPRVLVVDDDPAIRLICATWLSLDGYEVLEAEDGQEGLELALTEAPAAILLDLSMPILDGFCVAAALREDDRTRDLPLVVITAETGPHILERVHEIGVAGLFIKPFDPSVVAAFVRDVIAEFTTKKGRSAAGGHAF
jgi:CheY-like chemotaxis protein